MAEAVAKHGKPGGRPGNVNAVKSGVHSEPTVKRVATVQKRRLLRQVGLRAHDLDGLGLAYLDSWARAQSKVELLDAWFSERGFLQEDGSPAPGVIVYFTAVNSAARTLAKLEAHLRARHSVSATEALESVGKRVREERLLRAVE